MNAKSRSAFLLGTCALTAACGLTADFSGLQGGSRDGGAGDAASADSPSASDAGDAGGGFCASLATTPKLCADFDEARPVDFGWTQLDVSPGQTARVDANAFSAPGAFLSQIAPVSGPSSARLQESLPVLASRVHVEFEMLLGAGDPGPFELCALHEVTSDGATHGLFYKEEAGKMLVYMDTVDADGGRTQAIYPLGAPPPSWTKIEMDVTIGDDGSVTLKQDGAIVMQAIHVPTSTQTRAQLFVELGFYAFDSSTARASFDDVVVDWD